jgi:hypothetical protein
MADCRIIYISKSGNGHEHITHVGNTNWRWTKEAVIASIDAKTNTFFVFDPKTNKRAEVGVVRPTHGAPYLRTYADGMWNDNLLALPSFPTSVLSSVGMDARL